MYKPAVERLELMQSLRGEEVVSSGDFEVFISSWLPRFDGETSNFLSFMLTGYLTSDWHGWDLKNEKWLMAWSLLPMKDRDSQEVLAIREWWSLVYDNARGLNAQLKPSTEIHNLIVDFSRLWGLDGGTLSDLPATQFKFGKLNRVAELGLTIFDPTDMSFIGLMRLNDFLWSRKLQGIFDFDFHLRHFKCMQILFREFRPRERWMISEYAFKEVKLSELVEKYEASRFEFSDLLNEYESLLFAEYKRQQQQAALEERLGKMYE
jgi:hypothetical protein